jgi:hypothetical protein
VLWLPSNTHLELAGAVDGVDLSGRGDTGSATGELVSGM